MSSSSVLCLLFYSPLSLLSLSHLYQTLIYPSIRPSILDYYHTSSSFIPFLSIHPLLQGHSHFLHLLLLFLSRPLIFPSCLSSLFCRSALNAPSSLIPSPFIRLVTQLILLFHLSLSFVLFFSSPPQTLFLSLSIDIIIPSVQLPAPPVLLSSPLCLSLPPSVPVSPSIPLPQLTVSCGVLIHLSVAAAVLSEVYSTLPPPFHSLIILSVFSLVFFYPPPLPSDLSSFSHRFSPAPSVPHAALLSSHLSPIYFS